MVRILIADDERIERTVLYRTLHRNLKERCDIFQAQNGREAVAIHEEKKIQIAILDIEMRESMVSRRRSLSGKQIRTAASSF